MGCGSSRLDTDQEGAVPPRLRPLIRSRLEEIKMRTAIGGGAKGQSLSKKELLAHAMEEEVEVEEEEEEDEFSAAYSPPSPQKFEGSDSKENGLDETRRKQDNVKEKDGEREEEEEEDEEYVTTDDEEGRFIGPGSPSFRVYCANPSENSSDDHAPGHRSNGELDMIEGKQARLSDESTDSNEVAMRRTPKKKKKVRRFRKMIPRGGKNIFNVNSCYHASSEGNDATLQRPAS